MSTETEDWTNKDRNKRWFWRQSEIKSHNWYPAEKDDTRNDNNNDIKSDV